MSLTLYGHPFSSYTWKALIALYSAQIAFKFAMIDADHPDNCAFISGVGPLGKFPVLRDGRQKVFEATSIIEHLARHHPGAEGLMPADPEAAIGVRRIDRVFDNYVMNAMQDVVNEYIRDAQSPDALRVEEARARLERTYAWLETWLQSYPARDRITLVECAAAPALFYADWAHPIRETYPRLREWRAHLLALPPVARCVEEARPYRAFFPLGAPDRD